jgi:ribonuclease HI
MDRWEPPPEGWLKLNVDGSFVVQTGEAGVGVVTAWRVLYRCASADEAEAQACAEGLRLASQWCPGPIVVESDSARILTAMETDAMDCSELGHIILEAKEYLQMLVYWKLHKVKREGNKVAHELRSFN